MKILNRNGEIESWNTNRIHNRLTKLCLIEPTIEDVDITFIINVFLEEHVNTTLSEEDQITTTMMMINNNFAFFSTQEIDLAISRICMQYSTPKIHVVHQESISSSRYSNEKPSSSIGYIGGPSYGTLAARIMTSCLQKHTPLKFSDVCQLLYKQKVPIEFKEEAEKTKMEISDEMIAFVMKHKDVLNGAIVPERDYMFTYAAYTVLFSGYLFSSWIYPPFSKEEQEEAETTAKNNTLSSSSSSSFEEGINLTLHEFNRYSFVNGDYNVSRQVRREGGYVMFGKYVPADSGELGSAFGAKHVILETPQMMFMRLSVFQFMEEGIEKVLYAYEMNSSHKVSYGTPQFLNAGRKYPGLISCVIFKLSDNLEAIYDKVKSVAMASKLNGGIGSNCDLREKNRLIKSSGGQSSSITKPLKVFDATLDYVSQGGGKRKGVYSPQVWMFHPDLLDFIKSKDELHGSTIEDLQNLFHGILVPSFFLEMLFQPTQDKNGEDKNWYFFSILDAPELYNSHGEEQKLIYQNLVLKHKKLLVKYQSKKSLARGVINIYILWSTIKEILSRTSLYLINLDEANKKSNFTHLPESDFSKLPIRSTNLCTEIYLPVSDTEIACCNLATLVLPSFAKYNKKEKTWFFDFDDLMAATRFLVHSVDKAIDKNYYIVPEMQRSNLRHRPIGIGIQGLYDLYYKMKLTKKECTYINKAIAECIYYSALFESNIMAQQYGHYPSFPGSNFSKGKLQMHLWGYEKVEDFTNFSNNDENVIETLINARKNGVQFKPNWSLLIEKIKKHGTRHSQLTTAPPTASTSVIFNSSPSKDPHHSFHHSVEKNVGTVHFFNQYLIRDLQELGLYNLEILDKIILNGGSVQGIPEIPKEIKNRYKTGFELNQINAVLFPAKDRAIYNDQGEPINLFMAEFNDSQFDKYIATAFALGLKTLLYYRYAQSVSTQDSKGLRIEKSILSANMISSKSDKEPANDEPAFSKQNTLYNEIKITNTVTTCDPSCDSCGA